MFFVSMISRILGHKLNNDRQAYFGIINGIGFIVCQKKIFPYILPDDQNKWPILEFSCFLDSNRQILLPFSTSLSYISLNFHLFYFRNHANIASSNVV